MYFLQNFVNKSQFGTLLSVIFIFKYSVIIISNSFSFQLSNLGKVLKAIKTCMLFEKNLKAKTNIPKNKFLKNSNSNIFKKSFQQHICAIIIIILLKSKIAKYK